MKHPLLLFLLLFFSFSGKAQGDTANIEEYFDDGGLSNSIQVIKIVPTTLLQGEFSMVYDIELIESGYLEIGAGPIFPFYGAGLLDDHIHRSQNLKYIFLSETPKMGYGVQLYPRYKLKSIEGYESFIGLQIHHRKYAFEAVNWKYTDYTVNYRGRFHFSQRFIMDIDFGLGMMSGTRIDKIENIKDPQGIFSESVQIQVGFGMNI